MAFLPWSKDYEVGVAQIDSEHRKLFGLLNEFHDHHDKVVSRIDIANLLNRLVAYAEEHFQHEEKLMRELDYPLLDQHREQHGDLVTGIFSINERLVTDKAKATAETLAFLKNWLHHHILEADLNIGNFMRQKPHLDSKPPQGEQGAV